jgi:DNA recombination protein RmuC
MEVSGSFVAVVGALVALVALVGVVACLLVIRRDRAAEVLGSEDDAVARALAQLSATLVADRERSTQATIETVVSVANQTLGGQAATAARELELRSASFDDKVAGMHDELQRVRELVVSLQKEKAEQHGQFVRGINETLRVNAALAETTQRLRDALVNSRARGQWGERMAVDVLRTAGFLEGVNYRTQLTLEGGGRPDITFLLPRDRVLHMDVKFPIDNYLRVLECAGAERDDEREHATKAFLRDVRARVKELTARSYVDPDDTVGYVLLFIPNEAVYGFVHEHDPTLLDDALAQNVVLCSPCTLFAVLGVVRQAVDAFVLSRTSDEILECLNGFTRQWESFTGKLDQLGKQFETAQRSYEELSGTRRRQLQRHLDQVDVLRQRRDAGGGGGGTAPAAAIELPWVEQAS